MISNINNNLPNAANKHPDKELWDVSKKFESLLLNNMFKEMQATVPSSGGKESFAKDIHNTMFAQAVADSVSKSPSLGIAEAIYRQMSKGNAVNIDTTKDGTNGKIK